MDVLLCMAANHARILTKEELIEAVWGDVAVTPNSLDQAISGLRKIFGKRSITTVARRGYRFTMPVERTERRPATVSSEETLAASRTMVAARMALETLDLPEIVLARPALEELLRAAPDDAAIHLALASVWLLIFESTRSDAAPDVSALQYALHHARRGCDLAPSREAWITLADVFYRTGRKLDAVAAARKALTDEPDDSRLGLRFAAVTWGEARMNAACHVLRLCPDLALACWFVATVFVARQAFDPAMKILRAGCAAQDAPRTRTGRYHAVGLHLLLGLVLAAQGDLDGALEEFRRELALADPRHVYARECAANVWYAIGAIRLRHGRRDEAEAAFREALTRVSSHPLASVGLAATSPSFRPNPASYDANTVETAIVKAAVLALGGRHEEAARVCGDALAAAEPGSAGWLLPVDPLINATAHLDAWAPALAILRERAV